MFKRNLPFEVQLKSLKHVFSVMTTVIMTRKSKENPKCRNERCDFFDPEKMLPPPFFLKIEDAGSVKSLVVSRLGIDIPDVTRKRGRAQNMSLSSR